MIFGFSRDDAGKFIPEYLEKGILEADPFLTIDSCVANVMQVSSEKGKLAAFDLGNADFVTGVCGEHGGDAKSVKTFAKMGLNFVSCSPFRVPIARLASAQASIEKERELKVWKDMTERESGSA